MGFLDKTRLVIYSIIFMNFLVESSAQEINGIDQDFLYNEWSLSESELYDDILVYRDEGDFLFDNLPYNKDLNLKFTPYDNTFYLKRFGRRRPLGRCGNGPKYTKQISRWEKGVWKFEEEDGHLYLDLEYLVAIQGKSYQSIRTVEYRILELTEDKLVMQKIFEQSIH